MARHLTGVVRAFLIVGLFAPVASIRAQPVLRFERLGAGDGLSQSTVTALCQDREGFLWIGTQNGLNRYDGYRFSTYHHDASDPASLGDPRISALLEDSRGSLWVGTPTGLNRLDRATREFERFRFPREVPGLPEADYVDVLFEDSRGILWVGTRAGLRSFDRHSRRYAPSPWAMPPALESARITALQEDSRGRLWAGTSGAGAYSLDRSTGRFAAYHPIEGNPSGLSSGTITSIAEDREGTLWLGTANGGLNALPPGNGSKFVQYRHEESDPESLGSDHVIRILNDSSGRLWIATGRGLDSYDRERQMFDHHRHAADDPTSLSHDEVLSLLEDAQGMVWAGTRIGLNRWDPSTLRFGHLRKSETRARGLSGNLVSAVLRDSRNRLWVGTYGDGLNEQTKEDPIEFRQYGHNRGDPRSLADVRHLPDDDRPHDLAKNGIHAIFEGRDGTLWIGTGAGLHKRIPGTSEDAPAKFVRYQHKRGDPASLSHNEVTAIAEDEGGNLWVGTRGGGLDRLVEGDRIAFVHHAHRGDDPRSLSSDTVRALYKDSRGDLWIGTNAGLDRLVPGTAAEFVRHSADADAPGSLSHPVVTSIAEDRHGNLWVGTLGGGLNKLDRTTGRFTTYSEKDGLSSNLVNAVLLDDRGRVWMSTARGIARYDPESKAFRHYGPEDGVQSDEFTIGVAHRDGRGRMLFGGPNGLNDFHPEDIEDNPYRPPVVLTDLLVSNESVPLSEDGILTRNIGATERLALAYTDSQFAFEFSALNFRQPRKNRFAYRLDGFDEDWTHTHAENRRAVYTNVPPGRYTFRVKAANDDGLWNEDGRALAITIVPPWWHSLWFRGALLLGVLSLAYGGYRWRVGALERGSRKLEAKVSERTESLRLSEDRFRALSESTAEGIGIQEQGTLVDFNVALARIFGYEPDELRGKPILDLIAPESHNEVLSRIESGYEGAYEFTGLKKDGSRIAAEIHVRTIHHGGRVLRAGAIRDVTERKTKEAELLAAKEAAESANRAKSKFLSTMSHELRTPLHAILGFARIIARDASLSGEQRENATIIGRSGEHLLGLIDDVLEMSKLEAGRSALQIGYVDLRATAGIVEEMMRVRAREAGLALVIEEAPDAPAYALCDEHKLRQVLINLVGNAIKYTPQGRVTLRLCAAEIEGQSAVRFEVEDSGIGIASDRISEIFEPFVRHENPRVRATGTGLGLPISQEYVRLMGGSGIQAESRPGEGSVFSFTLPCGPAPAPDQARSTRPGRRVVALEPGEPEVRILIADDDAIGRKLLRRTLEPVGFAIEVAADGREALALHGSWHPHAILIDMRMPRMDGLSAVRGIREAEAGGDGASRTVVVGLTAEAFEEENREMALASGCDDFVTKPFRESELFELLRRHLGVRYVYEEPSEVARIEVREIDLDRRMRNLSPSLLAGLERAAAALDAQAIERLIEAIRAQDSPAAEDLLALAREFRYQRILALARDARDAARPLAVIDAPRG